MAHNLGLPQGARKSQLPLSTSISNILNIWSLSTIEIWPCCENGGILFFLSYKQGEQKAFASLTQQVTWCCWKNWFQEPSCPQKEKCPSCIFSSHLSPTWLGPAFHLCRDGFIPCPPLWECLMLSSMSVAGQWAWPRCHSACTDRAQPPHPVPSFHKCQQKLLTSLSPLSIATSLTSKGLGLPKKFNSQPSKSCSLEEPQYFLLEHPA